MLPVSSSLHISGECCDISKHVVSCESSTAFVSVDIGEEQVVVFTAVEVEDSPIISCSFDGSLNHIPHMMWTEFA